MGQDGAGDTDCAVQVYIQESFPLVVGELLEGPGIFDAGVIYQDVDTAEVGQRLLDGRGNFVSLGNVAVWVERLGLGALQALEETLGLVAADHRQGGAFAGQSLGNGAADSTVTGTGDQHSLS